MFSSSTRSPRRSTPGEPRTRRGTTPLTSGDPRESRLLLAEAAQNAHFSALLAAVVNSASSSR